jgi:hypothetical protein
LQASFKATHAYTNLGEPTPWIDQHRSEKGIYAYP